MTNPIRRAKHQNIVVGQRVRSDKIELARRLRKGPTPEENLLWQKLRGKQLAGLRVRRQQVIDGYVVDFYCHAAGLVIEVDGPVHHKQREEDAYRDTVLSGRDPTVLRITNEEVRADIDDVLLRILRAIETPLPVSGRGRGRGP